MSLGDITRAGVLAAVEECRHAGHETFLRRYGSGRATSYELVLNGNRYDSGAITGAAHLYSVGELLPADGSSGGARTVAHRLRALGFTVKEGSVATDEPQQRAPQVVLQPRGGPKVRGPRNFEKSIRQGVHIADIRHALGEQADALASLYPDGIARLWGSTPAAPVKNAKAKTLQNYRVGDDVLFYTKNHFIARAHILRLFRSRAVAQEVWGFEENGKTWEHIMALGEVEEFSTPVPAAPILALLNVPAPLWSLTLRSAEDYGRVTHLLPPRRRPVSPRPSAPIPTAPSPLTARGLLDRIGSLNTHRRSVDGARSRHQPLTLLWAISRIAAGKPRLAPWSSFRAEVSPLLAEFGLPSSKITPEYPFWHLQGSGLWEVHGMQSDTGAMPKVGEFNAIQPVAGLTFASAELLKNPLTRLEAVVKLCSSYLDDVDQRELLSRVGLVGYTTADGILDEEEEEYDQEIQEERAAGPTARRETTSSRPVRNPAIVSRVKEFHGHACQVCNTRLRYKRRPYSEAAHIRGLGSPHDGPDELPNLLCLCPNHHVLFDGLEIYIDVDGIVRWTHGGNPLGLLRRHVDHQIDEAHLQYHRTLCDLSRLTRK